MSEKLKAMLTDHELDLIKAALIRFQNDIDVELLAAPSEEAKELLKELSDVNCLMEKLNRL